ncbi:MAG: carboxypeptidase-like regulatory domain-containing protein [Planctomycetota bacterium]|nr:carboxypeptidase-like regulatory domain-containing protein [Planctomycetota bacterium]
MVWVRKAGFLLSHAELEPPAIRVRLTTGIPVRGRVIYADSGEPVAGARIEVEDRDLYENIGREKTSADGRFEVPAVRSNHPFKLTVSKQGFVTVGATYRRTGPGPELVVRLGAGGRVSGVVTDASGTPLASAALVIAPDGAKIPEGVGPDFGGTPRSFDARTVSDSKGGFAFAGLPLPGRYFVYGVRRPHVGRSAPFVLTEAQPRRNLELRLHPSATLEVYLFAPEGEEYTVAEVTVRGSGQGRDDGDDQGDHWRFEQLEAGSYEVYVDPADWLPALKRVLLAAGERRRLDFHLRPGLRLTGTVVDGNGRPQEDVYIEWLGERRDGWSVSRVYSTEEDGSFELSGLPQLKGLLRILGPPTLWREVVPGAGPLEIVLGGEKPGIAGRLKLVEHKLFYEISYEGGNLSGSTKTSASGAFEVLGVPAGKRFHAVLRPHDHAPMLFRDLKVEAGAVLDLGELTPDPGVTLRGRVLTSAGEPIEGARVEPTVALWVPEWRPTCRTNREGQWKLELMPQAAVRLEVTAEGYPRAWPMVEITATPEVLDVVLPQGGRVAGLISDASGKALPGAQVVAYPVREDGTLDRERYADLVVDHLGRMRGLLLPGRYQLMYYSDDRWTPAPSHEFTITDGETTAVEFRIK